MADVRVWSWDRLPYGGRYDEVVVNMTVFGNGLRVHVVLDEEERAVDVWAELGDEDD